MKQIIDTANIQINNNGKTYSIIGTIISLKTHSYVVISIKNEKDDEDNSVLYELSSHGNDTTATSSRNDEIKDDGTIIESCCIYITKTLDIYCSTALENKSLFLYEIPTTISKLITDQEQQPIEMIKPTTTYKTERKVCSSSFHTIIQNNEEKNNIGIFIADVQGDVTAYPLLQTSKKRILLGHTASILTSMKIVNDKILTSDRDEKIRISSFPNTWSIHGYLLGHTDYVTCIDVCNDICVSCSGDGCIKLWNYECFSLLGTYSCSDNQNDNGNNKAYSRISIHSSGKYVAATQQQSQSNNTANPIIELFKIESSSEGNDCIIKLIQTISSSVISPISLKFLPSSTISILIICTQPNYIIHYQYNHTTNLFDDISNQSYYHNTLSKLGKENNITMPALENISHLQGGRSSTKVSTEEWNTIEKKNVARDKDNRRKYRKKIHTS